MAFDFHRFFRLSMGLGFLCLSACEKNISHETKAPETKKELVQKEIDSEVIRLFQKTLEGENYHNNFLKLNNWKEKLSVEEVEWLLVFIQRPTPKEVEFGRYAEMYNEALNMMHKNGVDGELLIDPLMVNAKDETRSETIRNYSIQHMAHLDFKNADDLKRMEKYLLKLVKDNDYLLGGVALNTLSMRVWPMYSQFGETRTLSKESIQKMIEPAEFIKLLKKMIFREDVNHVICYESLQILRNQNQKDILPRARELAADPSTPLNIQMCVVGILGEWGEQEDIKIIKQIRTSDRSLQKIARNAKASIKKRLN